MLLVKEKRDVKPYLVKFGVTLAISFAGFLYVRFRKKRIKPSNSHPPNNNNSDKKVDHHGGKLRTNDDHQHGVDSCDKPCVRVRANTLSRHATPRGRHSEGKDGFLLPEFDQLVKDMSVERDLPKTIYSVVERHEYEHEIESLKRRIRYLRERERKLEVQLLEYYGLKEQEKAMMELQNRVKINNIEAKLFSVKIESLEAENVRLVTQVSDYSKVVSELEDAKAKIKLLKRKIRHEAQQNKEQILELTQRVTRFRDHEHEAASNDSNVHKMTALETEAEELRKSNENLQQENADLAQRLESTQFLANSLLEDQEKEELNKEIVNLREENEKLAKEAERLQADRCGDAEELVYLRWINACLRYELRHYEPPPGKTVARDLSKCLSPTSEKKAKQLILEYANTEDGDQKDSSIVDFDFDNWPSSQPSYLTDSTDDSPRHGSSNKHHKKFRIFTKLRRLITGKSSRASPIHRSSSVEDLGRRRWSSESPRDNSRYDGGTDDSLKFASSSQNSNNSLEFQQPLSRLDEEVSVDVDNSIRMSQSTNDSPRTYRHERDSEDGQKSELVKYARVIRDSRSSPRMHKKSASICTG
ncbi:hypothetical protein vseg_020816 [Gypsophila vaccaria]